MQGPTPVLRRRLFALTGLRLPPFDSRVAREQALSGVARARGDEGGALRLEAASREGVAELRRPMDRAEAALREREHTELFLRLASKVLGLQQHEFDSPFWAVVSRLLDAHVRDSKARAALDAQQDELDHRVEQYVAARPLLSFPAAQVHDEDAGLLDAVLTDQRGISTGTPFSARASQLYDRRYVACLRFQLYRAEEKARAQQERVRALEQGLDGILAAGDLEHAQALARGALSAPAELDAPDRPHELQRRTLQRLAATLRDLAEELRALPDRLNAAPLAARRNHPPEWLARTLKLARVAGFDATSLGLLERFEPCGGDA
jgi:hypothetical protein